jgi:hypothetical protein
MIMELAPFVFDGAGASFEDLVSLIEAFDYGIYDLGGDRQLPSDAHGLRKLIPEGAGLNVLLLPAS